MLVLVSDLDKKKLDWMREYELSLNARVKVENVLWDTANGLRAAPTAEECKELAIMLGVPDSWRKK
jgi:hypothetical protein